MPIKLNGSSSGFTQIDAASVAGNNTLTLPTASGTLMTTGGTNTFTANQAISVTDNTNPALDITQLGTSAALRVNTTNQYNGISLVSNNRAWQVGSSSTALVTMNFQQDALAFANYGVERMRIEAGGNVGIGTASPGKKLDVSGTIRASGSFNPNNSNWVNSAFSGSGSYGGGLSLVDGTAGYGIFAQDSGGTLSISQGSTSGGLTERMRIDSSGNVLIGTNAASARFVTFHNGNAPIGRFENSFSGYGSEALQVITAQASGTGFNLAAFYVSNAAAYALRIRGDGNVYNANGVYAAASDQRIKENIVDTGPKLDDMMRVRVRNYNLIGSELKQIGVVAQELEEVFPGLVEETIDKDASGNELGTTTKSVKYSVFVPMLIKALQEANDKIDALEARIAALENA